jgi:VWFA-related protein
LTIDEINKENFPEMEVFVTVADINGVPIQGLGKGDFEVIEDGIATGIEDVGWRINEEAVIAIALVIDVSGSMRGKPLDDAKEAAIGFIDALNPSDLAAIIAFGDKVDLGEPFPKIDPAKEIDFTLDHGALKNLVNALEAEEKARTPLYDAMFKAVKMTAQQPIAKKAVILLTDGREKTAEERASIMEPDDPIREANRNRIPIFTIGLGEDIDKYYLEKVALRTGGIYEETPDSARLAELFQKVAESLKHQYIISYTSQVLADEKEHSLLLKVRALGSEAEDEGTFFSKRIRPTFDIPPLPAEISRKTTVTLEEVTAQGGVAKVEYLIDGEVVFTASSVPCSYELDPTVLRPGDHVLTVKVYDPAGNVGGRETTFRIPVPQISPAMVALAALLALLVIGAVIFVALQRRRPPAPYEVGPPVGPEVEFPTEAGIFRREEIPPTERAAVPEAMPGVEVARVPEPTISLRPERRHLAWLIMEKGERVGQEFRLHEGDTSIGRAGTNDIVLEDPTVSRQQAKIRLEGDEFYIYDLGATNPTRVNGRVITKQKLADGDRVEMGNTVFVFKRA